jgi:5S rRNA maturation endonuclease (ribonuclease M5)
MDTDLKALKQQIDLRQFVQQAWGLPARSRSHYDQHYSRWRDDGRKPSFTVYDQHFHDFGGNGEGGDIYDFLRQEYKLTLPQAIQRVQEMVGQAPLASFKYKPLPSHKSDQCPSLEWQRIAAEEWDRAVKYLWSGSRDALRVLDYLRSVRGLTAETIRRWGIGYNPKWRKTKYRNPKTGKCVSLAPGIIIPVFCDNALWGLRIRCRVGNLAQWLGIEDDAYRPGDTLPKYLSLSGGKLTGSMFNGDNLDTGKPVLIVEGELDAMLAQQELGDGITVITLGSASNRLTARWKNRLADASTLYLTLDADTGGQKATQHLLSKLETRCQVLPLPAGKDITEFHINHEGDIQAWFQQATAKAKGPFPKGLPDSWRRVVLNYLSKPAAPLLELMIEGFRYGLLNPEDFTISELQQAGRALGFRIASPTLYRGINALEQVFFSKLHTDKEDESVCKIEKNTSPKGRKANHYRMLSLPEIEALLLIQGYKMIFQKHHPVVGDCVLALPTPAMIGEILPNHNQPEAITAALMETFQTIYDAYKPAQARALRRIEKDYQALIDALSNHHSTPLPKGWALEHPSNYRAAFLRAVCESKPEEQRSRRQMAELLGISRRNVTAAVKRAGLKNEEQPLQKFTVTRAHDLHRQVTAQAYHLKGFPKFIVAETSSGEVKRIYDATTAQTFAKTYLGQGATLRVEFQVASKQRVVRHDPPAHRVLRLKPVGGGGMRVPRLARKKTEWKLGFSPEWLIGQLKLTLQQLSGYHKQGERLIDKETGEILSDDLAQLGELLLQKLPSDSLQRCSLDFSQLTG